MNERDPLNTNRERSPQVAEVSNHHERARLNLGAILIRPIGSYLDFIEKRERDQVLDLLESARIKIDDEILERLPNVSLWAIYSYYRDSQAQDTENGTYHIRLTSED